MSAAQEDIDDSSAPLIEHLTELRTRLIRSVLAFLVAMILCFTVADPIFNWLSQPVCDALAKRGQDCSLVMIKLQEGFFVAIRISFIGGFALSFPFIGYQLWRFVAPGLYRSEKNAFLPFLIASPFMFFLGAAFAYYVILPMAFDFFLGFQQGIGVGEAGQPEAGAAGTLTAEGDQLKRAGIIFQGSIEEYLALTIKFIMAFGMCFQLPVLLTLMGKAGLVSSDGMASVRKYAIVGILVLAAIVTPPDVFSQIILFAVVYGLYEISILLVRMIEKKRAKAEAEEEAELFGEDPPPAPPSAPAPTPPAPTPPAPAAAAVSAAALSALPAGAASTDAASTGTASTGTASTGATSPGLPDGPDFGIPPEEALPAPDMSPVELPQSDPAMTGGEGEPAEGEYDEAFYDEADELIDEGIELAEYSDAVAEDPAPPEVTEEAKPPRTDPEPDGKG